MNYQSLETHKSVSMGSPNDDITAVRRREPMLQHVCIMSEHNVEEPIYLVSLGSNISKHIWINTYLVASDRLFILYTRYPTGL